MGRAPCCDKANVKKGPWSPEEDAQLKEYMEKHGTGGNWIALPQKAGLKRCGKSCRLRWLNYLRPNIKHGEFSDDEERIICCLFASIGSRWSIIASQLPGRTDNDIKNYWNTKLKKKMMGLNPSAPHHQTTLVSVLQNSTPSSSSSSASSPLSFTDSTNSYWHLPHGSFPGSDQSMSYPWTSFLRSHSSCASAGSFYQPQESLMGPIQNYQVKDGIFMFGGEAASCSSSDGSCNNNQMSHAKEAEVGYGGDHGTFVEQMTGVNNNYNYLQSGMEMEESQKVMGSDGGYVSGWTEKQSGLWEENPPLDYGIEELKHLISTNSCNNFLFDENMTQKRAVYYY